MSELILHIGHGKTGTSFIQSVLALNSEYLQKWFHYPYHPSFDGARKGHITTGNTVFLSEENIDFTKERILYSSEFLFFRLLNEDFFRSLCKNHNVKVILYTRNILDYLFSSWGQNIKRNGSSMLLDEYLQQSPRHPYNLILEWLNASISYGFQLNIRNYSNHRNNLIETFLSDILGHKIFSEKCNDLILPSLLVVNRSLSGIEYEIQRLFNMVESGKKANYISDALVNELPDHPIEKLRCSNDSYVAVVKYLSPFVEKINDKIHFSERLEIGDPSQFVCLKEHSDTNLLSVRQLQILVKVLKKRFLLIHSVEDKADQFRDLALKIDSGIKPSLDDALMLMKVAGIYRPNGPVISRKIAEWESRLKNRS